MVDGWYLIMINDGWQKATGNGKHKGKQLRVAM